ncbi:MAG: hypothetical protein ACQKBV_09470 [Puniceicoccales bacterium]
MERMTIEPDGPEKFWDEESRQLYLWGPNRVGLWIMLASIVVPIGVGFAIGSPLWGFLAIPLVLLGFLYRRAKPARCAKCGEVMQRSYSQTFTGPTTDLGVEFYCEKCGAYFSQRRKKLHMEDIR